MFGSNLEIWRTFRSRTNRAKRFMPFGVQKNDLFWEIFMKNWKKNYMEKYIYYTFPAVYSAPFFQKWLFFRFRKIESIFFTFIDFRNFHFHESEFLNKMSIFEQHGVNDQQIFTFFGRFTYNCYLSIVTHVKFCNVTLECRKLKFRTFKENVA